MNCPMQLDKQKGQYRSIYLTIKYKKNKVNFLVNKVKKKQKIHNLFPFSINLLISMIHKQSINIEYRVLKKKQIRYFKKCRLLMLNILRNANKFMMS